MEVITDKGTLTRLCLFWRAQLRLQPDEAIYMKIVVKKPGLEMDSIVSELDLSYKQRYTGAVIPDAYERLILDAIRGDQQHFVRRWGFRVFRDYD